jgi:alpha-ketoglutarate-dependent taurine dioxygenase
MKLTPIKESWGTEVEFSNPREFFQQDPHTWRTMIYDRHLIIFKRMNFELLDYMKFTHWFGQPWTEDAYRYSRELSTTLKDGDQTYVTSEFSNRLISTKRIGLIEMPWHSDIPNRRERPFPHRSLWIVKNPNPEQSGKTKWLNVNLPQCERYLSPRLLDLLPRVTVKQQSWYNQGTDEQMHSFIKVHPVTGERSIRLNYYNDPSKNIHNAWIKEVYIDGKLQADCSLIGEYIEHLLQFEELVHYHQWDTYDIAIYDNYPFVHGRTALILNNEERKFYRTNIDHCDLKDLVPAL